MHKSLDINIMSVCSETSLVKPALVDIKERLLLKKWDSRYLGKNAPHIRLGSSLKELKNSAEPKDRPKLKQLARCFSIACPQLRRIKAERAQKWVACAIGSNASSTWGEI